MQAAIEARSVSYRTRAGEIIVRDMSLTVGHGELVAIIGGIGSGKATLLDAMSGLRQPTSGTVLRHVRRDGRPAAGPSSPQIGYVPYGDTIYPVLPLARALRYAAALHGVRGAQRAVAEALDRVGLAAEAAAPVGSLNQGERKRAAIAAELLACPAQLFLDEPTAGLDQAQATQVLRLLRRLSDDGTTVVLTTSSPLDAARCDKVAVLATGGHLAFFGTPAAARGYFGADSLDEIYERLAGLGDPSAAWSRRFFYFSGTSSGFAPVPTAPPPPGPALLVPDLAGPHSAGRPSWPFASDLDHDYGDRDHRRAPGLDGESGPASEHGASEHGASEHGRDLDAEHEPASGAGPAAQLRVLVTRNAETLARARRQQAILAGAPAVVLVAFCILLVVGALDGPAAVSLAWAVLGGLATGLAYDLSVRGPESGVFRREGFAGLSVAMLVAAKAAVLLPILAIADVLILVVPAFADRLVETSFGLSYLTVFVASALGFVAANAGTLARRAPRPQ